MSRRLQPSAEKAAHNQQTLKALVKVESNKSCADCKRNKHPRWASWNLGIFICIRCSGIHRGMGTHISRVKSVDLDAWTDEQLQSMLRWGNARANRYWEAKLASGHMPSEAKMENFIRTKYESQRWIMDGGMPDPATLDVGEDTVLPPREVPVISKQADGSTAMLPRPPAPRNAPPKPSSPNIDLFGEEPSSITAPSFLTTRTIQSVKPESSAPKQTKPVDSLLGFDFFGSTQSGSPSRPGSAGASQLNTNIPSRPDLKQSILSLYASNQKTSPPASQQLNIGDSSNSRSAPAAMAPPQQPNLPNINDAFSSLTFGSMSATPQQVGPNSHPDLFATLVKPPPNKQSSANAFNAPPQNGTGAGNFFTMKSATSGGSAKPPLTEQISQQRGIDPMNEPGLDSFDQSSEWASTPQTKASNDITNAYRQSNVPTQLSSPSTSGSVFNLSTSLKPAQTGSLAASSTTLGTGGPDPWSSNDVWTTSPSATVLSQPTPQGAASIATNTSSSSWGWADTVGGNNHKKAPPMKQPVHVAGDEDFGGWGSSSNTTSSAQPPKQNNQLNTPARPAGGFGGGGDDLFSNVWE